MLEKIIATVPQLVLQKKCTTVQMCFYCSWEVLFIRHMSIGTYLEKALIQCICISSNCLTI